MTRLEQALLARIRTRLAALDPDAASKLAALKPVLQRLVRGYDGLGAAARKTAAALLPELAELMRAAEEVIE